jgi:hypothetical protein
MCVGSTEKSERNARRESHFCETHLVHTVTSSSHTTHTSLSLSLPRIVFVVQM